jgi:hypothetical protein
MGVHGIEQFNFFCTDQPKIPGLRADYAALRHTHDAAWLRGKPKHYCLSSPRPPFDGMGDPGADPGRARPQAAARVPPDHGGRTRRGPLRVEIAVEKTPEPARLGLSWNGAWPRSHRAKPRRCFPVGPFTHFTAAHTAWEFALDPAGITRWLEHGDGHQQLEDTVQDRERRNWRERRGAPRLTPPRGAHLIVARRGDASVSRP